MDEDEVLFLTSRERIYEAFLRWYNHSDNSTPEYNRTQALDQSRTLMRYLTVPTVQEIERYREEPIVVE